MQFRVQIRKSISGVALLAFTSQALGAAASAPQTIDVQTSSDLVVSAKDKKQGLLVGEISLPPGSIVTVTVSEFQGARDYAFWNGKTQAEERFVKNVHVVSAPGFSAQDIAEINAMSDSLFMPKTNLGDSVVVDTHPDAPPATHQPAPHAEQPRMQQMVIKKSATVLRDEGTKPNRGNVPRPRDGHEQVGDLVRTIDQTNQALHTAGSTGGFCPGCEAAKITPYANQWIAQGVPAKALREALAEQAKNPQGLIHNRRYLTIVDLTQHSSKKRMFVLDLSTGKFQSFYTTHGIGSEVPGQLGVAKNFSNRGNSKTSPAGFHVTGWADARGGLHTTDGIHHSPGHGKSLLLIGLEGQNGNSAARHILIHEASYATEAFIRRYGYAGRSEGCLGIDPKELPALLAEIQGGSLVYNYTGS